MVFLETHTFCIQNLYRFILQDQLEPQIEAIIDHKVYSGKVYYLVKWKGCPQSQNTWQIVKILKPYRHLLRQFKKRRNKGFDRRKSLNLKTKEEQDSSSSSSHIEVPKKRGRPPKKYVKDQNNNFTEKKDIPTKIQTKTSKESLSDQKSTQQEDIRNQILEKSRQLIKIHFYQKEDDETMMYTIEQKEQEMRKCTTAEMLKLYSKQLVQFLEKTLISLEKK